jgi:transposase
VVSMPRTRPPYPVEFRREAVQLLRSSGRKVSEIARDLGVSEQTLRNWAKQTDVDEGRAHGLTSEDREELGRLRREVRVLREEREILRKAAAFFAKESDRTR